MIHACTTTVWRFPPIHFQQPTGISCVDTAMWLSRWRCRAQENTAATYLTQCVTSLLALNKVICLPQNFVSELADVISHTPLDEIKEVSNARGPQPCALYIMWEVCGLFSPTYKRYSPGGQVAVWVVVLLPRQGSRGISYLEAELLDSSHRLEPGRGFVHFL